MQLAYITHSDCAKHEIFPGHPESPKRLEAINKKLIDTGLMDSLQCHDAIKATGEEIHRAHTKLHVQNLVDNSPEHGQFALDADTSMNPYSLDAALYAAGSGVLATDLVLTGKAQRAFCNVRPPGHHAELDKAMGFCFFNNIAIAALHALVQHKLERVAIVDFDVHHGNGTEDIVGRNEKILFCSSYQHPFYPGYAGESIENQIVNVPLKSGTSGEKFRDAISKHWVPALEQFKPQCLFVSAGFDAHKDDPIGGCRLDENDYSWVTKEICNIANRHAHGRIISMLEGGYNLRALGESVVAHLRELRHC